MAKKVIKKILSAVIACSVAMGWCLSINAVTNPPGHVHIYSCNNEDLEQTVIGARTHTYVIRVENNHPVLGTCVIEEVRESGLYKCDCGLSQYKTRTFTRHTAKNCGMV